MGDSYRAEISSKTKRSGYAAKAMVRSGAETRAALREQYFRKSPAGRRYGAKAAQAQIRMNF